MNDDVKAIVEMVRKLAVVVDSLEQRARQSDQMQQQTTQALQQTLAGVRSDVDRLVQGAEHRTAQTVRQSMDAALGDVVARSERAVTAFSAKPAQAGQALEQSMVSSMARLQRLIFMAYASVVGAMLLVFAGGALLLWRQQQSYEDARARTEAAKVSADTAALYAQVGVSSCGGQPCLKLDPKAPHWGAHGEYVMLAPKAHK